MNGPRLYLGIDPGQNGGIAVLDGTGRVVQTFKLADVSDTDRDLWDTLVGIGDLSLDETGQHQVSAVLEKVSTSPQMGVVSAGTFMGGYRAIRMALTAAGIPFEEVRPQAWQKALGCLTRGDKNVTKTKAQQLFPSVKVTHANADALLIAEHGRRSALGITKAA